MLNMTYYNLSFDIGWLLISDIIKVVKLLEVNILEGVTFNQMIVGLSLI